MSETPYTPPSGMPERLHSPPQSRRKASYAVAAFWFWLTPIAAAPLYYTLATGFGPQPNRHGFEQGILGLMLIMGLAAIVSTVNLAGFGTSVGMFRAIPMRSRAYYLTSGIAGVASLLAFVVVTNVWSGPVSTSNSFWFAFYTVIACFGSVVVSTVVFAIAYVLHAVDRR